CSHRWAGVERHAADIFAPQTIREGLKNGDSSRTHVGSTRYGRTLLASPHPAKRECQPEAVTRCGDVSGAAGKESQRLPAQLTSAGGLMATADYIRAVTS